MQPPFRGWQSAPPVLIGTGVNFPLFRKWPIGRTNDRAPGRVVLPAVQGVVITAGFPALAQVVFEQTQQKPYQHKHKSKYMYVPMSSPSPFH